MKKIVYLTAILTSLVIPAIYSESEQSMIQKHISFAKSQLTRESKINLEEIGAQIAKEGLSNLEKVLQEKIAETQEKIAKYQEQLKANPNNSKIKAKLATQEKKLQKFIEAFEEAMAQKEQALEKQAS